eukprot:SAG11_NODE_2006_length_3928_cov_7.941499_1_plen_285_part_00
MQCLTAAAAALLGTVIFQRAAAFLGGMRADTQPSTGDLRQTLELLAVELAAARVQLEKSEAEDEQGRERGQREKEEEEQEQAEQEEESLLSVFPEHAVTNRQARRHSAAVWVEVGTSRAIERDPALPERIAALANEAHGHTRLSADEVRERLAMGDDAMRRNRVLHLAWARAETQTMAKEKACPTGEAGEELLGICSSTFAVPWCESGCGHWGLLAVSPAAQGRGVGRKLVASAEARLAGCCSAVQIEYRFHPRSHDARRLHQWCSSPRSIFCPQCSPRAIATQ